MAPKREANPGPGLRQSGFVAVAAVAFVLASCGNSSNGQPSDGGTGSTLRLTASGLPSLEGGSTYEGWAIIGDQPKSTGKFNVGSGGGLVTPSGSAVANGDFATGLSLTQATAIVITIEPANDADPAPAMTHVLAGALSGTSATLTVGAQEAIGSSFSSAAGKYILATPTDGMGSDEKSGLWFLDPSSGSPAAGLTLPTLPAGWMYEGWAVIGGTPVSTGKFTSPSGADESAPYSGTMAGPPFPGEDFLMNAPSGVTFPTDLTMGGDMAVITVEPDPDDAAGPFGIKPLVHAIPSSATDHQAITMDNAAAQLPTATATVR